jgi:hypothetical protein
MKGYVIDIKDHEEAVKRGKEIARYEADNPNDYFKNELPRNRKGEED